MLVLVNRQDDEISVSVPFSLKDRVKKVKGYRWDPGDKVWIFPYSEAIHAQLATEFPDAMFSGFEPEPEPEPEDTAFGWGSSHSQDVLRRDIKLLRDNLLEARARIDVLEQQLADAHAKVKALRDSESILSEPELKLLRAHRELVLEQSRKNSPISW